MSDQTPTPFQSPDSAAIEKIGDDDFSKFWTARKVHWTGIIGLLVASGVMGIMQWIAVSLPPSQFRFLAYVCYVVALLIMISSALCIVSSHWFPNPKGNIRDGKSEGVESASHTGRKRQFE
ncbi:MAG: hypothetical protein AAF939_01225 [Planctomycetota bacterium]